jgi:hypothetical protein
MFSLEPDTYRDSGKRNIATDIRFALEDLMPKGLGLRQLSCRCGQGLDCVLVLSCWAVVS